MEANLLAYLAPGLAEALAVIGTTLGIRRAASVGLSIIAEEPAVRTYVLLLSFLPATQTLVYGFAFMYFMYIQYLPSAMAKYGGALPFTTAAAFLGVSLFVGLAELFSAWMQGIVCADAISLLVKTRGTIFSMGIILAAYEELFGMLGLVFGLMVVPLVI
ncbi:MAG: ATPase [Desulfurococcaceae archaeon]|jgi:V/A-type H+-transporting ATPase subunit K|nr:ATPase [Desulfurococcaceae archaeon]